MPQARNASKRQILNKHSDKSVETRQRSREATINAWADPEKRQRIIEAIKRAVNKPEARKRKSDSLKRTLANPEARQRRSKAMKCAWSGPERRKFRSEAMKRRLAVNPDCLKSLHEGLRRAWDDPEKRKQMSEANRLRLADPDVQKRKGESIRRALAQDPSRKARTSELLKNVWAKHRSKSGRRGRRPGGDDEPKRILELYNQLTANRPATTGPGSAVWKTIKEAMDREFGNVRSEEAYKIRLRRHLMQSAGSISG